jgi:hypothetical protein
MKTLLTLLLSFLTLSAFAAGASDDPSGTWKWKATIKGHEIESTLVLSYKDAKLSGTIDNRAGKTEIKNASFSNGDVSFTVEREFRRKKFSTQYKGRLEGNAINGTIMTTGGKDDQSGSAEWHATRS